MNESITILKKMLSKAESLPETAENKESIKTALADAISALEEKERASKPSGEGNEFGLTADPASDHLFNLSMGLPAEEKRRASAVNHLASLVHNVPERESEAGPAGDLAKLVRRYD